MTRINVHEAKIHLSRYLKQVEAGEVVVLCRRNVAIAELRPISEKSLEPRPLGLAKGIFEIPPAFDEPLPPDIEAAFDGRGR